MGPRDKLRQQGPERELKGQDWPPSPGMSHINNLPLGTGCCAGRRMRGQKVTPKKALPEDLNPSPHALEISPCLFYFRIFRGCHRLQDDSQVFSVLLDRPGRLARLC